MNKDLKQGSSVKSEISPADGKPMLGDVNSYLDYLDAEILKAQSFGRDFQHKDNDLKSAEKWHCISEALLVAKEKAIEILKVEHSPSRKFRNKVSGVEGVLIKRVSKVFKGDTFVVKCDDGREYFAPAREWVPA